LEVTAVICNVKLEEDGCFIIIPGCCNQGKCMVCHSTNYYVLVLTLRAFDGLNNCQNSTLKKMSGV